MSSTCTATKRDGSPCTLPAIGPEGLCWAHDPKNAEKRRRGQSRGGRSKPSKELINIKQRLSDLADDVLAGEIDKGVASVASQVLNVYLRAITTELAVREQEELAREVEELREIVETNKEANRWGA